VWHQETHSRCRDKLVRQLYWACEKDIYRLTRRNKKRTGNDEAWIKKSPTDRKSMPIIYVEMIVKPEVLKEFHKRAIIMI